MITLPTLPTSVTSETGVETLATGDNLLATDDASQGFVTLLGNRLLTLAQQAGSQPPANASRATDDEKGTPVAELNALLAALDKPEALNALLQPENVKGETKSADDKKADLSDSDKQTLQALFAMLPPSTVQPVQTTVNHSDRLSSEQTHKGNTLSAMLGNLTAKTAEDDKTEADSKTALTGLSTNANGASLTGKSDAGSSQLSASTQFQQVLGNAVKDEQKDLTPAHSNIQLHAAVASATSAPIIQTASATTMAPVTPQLNAQLGSPEWQQALSQQILMFNRNGQQNAELRLHPQDLGSIQISLKLDNDQAQLNMVSGHSQVRAALEAALPQLRHALAESGINLGQSSVSSDAFPQSQSFSDGQQSRRESNNGSFAGALESDSEITPIAVPAALQARAAGNSAVDIFA